MKTQIRWMQSIGCALICISLLLVHNVWTTQIEPIMEVTKSVLAILLMIVAIQTFMKSGEISYFYKISQKYIAKKHLPTDKTITHTIKVTLKITTEGKKISNVEIV